MSRTYRRKNYEDTQGSSWDRRGRKTAGFYTECDWESPTSWLRIFRAPTKAEYNKAYRRNHGDKRPNYYGPNHFYRELTVRKNRRDQKHEIFKYLRNEDYEPIFESRARDAWWDWC